MQDVAVIGLGYFSQFHLAAWQANQDVRLVAVADLNSDRLHALQIDVPGFTDAKEMLARHDPDIVDIIAPPTAHADLIRASLQRGRTIICQKPFCSSYVEAEKITLEAEAAGATLVIHENFRFQPWYRTIKGFLESGRMGKTFGATFALRPGDGRGKDAYLARQPSFQTMPRFLLQETAIHLFDTFQWLLGPVRSVYADLRRLNPQIQGEDAGHVILTHESGARTVFDGNRLADHKATDRRRTMGELSLDGEAGQLSLNGNGALFFREFGTNENTPIPLNHPFDATQFGGGCVAALIDHVVKATASGSAPENTAREYLGVMRIVEAAYQSDANGCRIDL